MQFIKLMKIHFKITFNSLTRDMIDVIGNFDSIQPNLCESLNFALFDPSFRQIYQSPTLHCNFLMKCPIKCNANQTSCVMEKKPK